MTSSPRIKLAALIAGGKSRRMGRDKALLKWGGKPLWRYQWETLAALEPERLVVVAPEPPSWLPTSVEWVKDHGEQNDPGLSSRIRPIGPIGGVLAALELIQEGLVAALAVDLPAMTPEYLAGLQADCSVSTGVVPHSPEGFEPLAAIYPAAAAASARQWIGEGHHDLQGWIGRLVNEGIVLKREVGLGELALFLNLNTPEDLR